VPCANVRAPWADVAVKAAREAAVMPTATSTVASAASVRRGRETRTDRRDIRVTLLGEGLRATWRRPRKSCDDLLDEVAAGNRAISRSETPGFASPPRDGFAL